MNRYLYIAAIQDGSTVRFFTTFIEADDALMAHDDGYVRWETEGMDEPDDLDRFLNDFVVCLGPAIDSYGDGYFWDIQTEQYLLR